MDALYLMPIHDTLLSQYCITTLEAHAVSNRLVRDGEGAPCLTEQDAACLLQRVD